MRYASRIARAIVLFAIVLAIFPLVGCSSPGATTQAAYAYSSTTGGAVIPATRSASDGSTEPGPQELLGIYLPFGDFDVKGAVRWNRKASVITIPAPFAEPAAACAPQYVDVQRTVMVPETYTETKTRMVPRTVTERRAVVPTPQAAPCAPPAPQAAPQGCPEPPPSPVACGGPECGVSGR